MGCHAVAERLAAPCTLGDRGFVLGEELAGTIGPARVRIQKRETEIRPIFGGERNQMGGPPRPPPPPPGGGRRFLVMHLDGCGAHTAFPVPSPGAPLLVPRPLPPSLGLS